MPNVQPSAFGVERWESGVFLLPLINRYVFVVFLQRFAILTDPAMDSPPLAALRDPPEAQAWLDALRAQLAMLEPSKRVSPLARLLARAKPVAV